MRYCSQYIFILFLFLFPGRDGFARSFRIASVNIRLDTKKDSLNPWSTRKDLLVGFVLDNDLDIVCMQEVLPKQYRFLSDTLSEYSSVYEGRGDKSGEGVPIFYKSKIYDCLGSGTFGLSEFPDSIKNKGWDAKYPRVATWAKLKNRNNGKTLCVVSTHLDHVGKIARRNGMMTIKQRIKNLAGECPVVISGDMNSGPNSETVNIAKTALFPMQDAYEVAKKHEGVTYTYHRFGKKMPIDSRNRSDYVFVSKSIKVKTITIPREEQDEQTGVFMTDHCPVIVDMYY